MDPINELIVSGIERSLFTACAISVYYKNNLLYCLCGGLLDPRKDVRVTPETFFDLASLTKLFISTSFMKLVERGLVVLDMPVGEIIPEYKLREKSKVTFRHLLSHSSGLPASFNLYEKMEWKKGKTYVINKLLNMPLINEPGVCVVYSCLGFILLGYAMEIITGKNLEAIIENTLSSINLSKDIIYKPYLHSDNIAVTTYTRPNRGVLLPGVVHDGNAIAIDEGISGNAGLFGKCSAIAKFGKSFLDGTILTPSYIHEMISLQAETNHERRGLGWKLWSNQESNPARILSPDVYGHLGFTGTSLWIDPKYNLAISCLTNSVFFYKDNNDKNSFKDFVFLLHQTVLSEISSK